MLTILHRFLLVECGYILRAVIKSYKARYNETEI